VDETIVNTEPIADIHLSTNFSSTNDLTEFENDATFVLLLLVAIFHHTQPIIVTSVDCTTKALCKCDYCVFVVETLANNECRIKDNTIFAPKHLYEKFIYISKMKINPHVLPFTEQQINEHQINNYHSRTNAKTITNVTRRSRYSRSTLRKGVGRGKHGKY
jgi:hypothetical protein